MGERPRDARSSTVRITFRANIYFRFLVLLSLTLKKAQGYWRTLHNFSLFAIILPKIIKIGGNLTKFWRKQFCTVF